MRSVCVQHGKISTMCRQVCTFMRCEIEVEKSITADMLLLAYLTTVMMTLPFNLGAVLRPC